MKIQYAIKIETGTSLNDGSVGLVDGNFQFITGRPEINGWFQELISKTSITTLSRRIDISGSGEYGTLSGFNFSIINQAFRQFLTDRALNLWGSTTIAYVVIDTVFYQVWTGEIAVIPNSETEVKFVCKSDFKGKHRLFPPSTIDGGKNDGKPIPVAFGDVLYNKLLATDAIPEWETLLNENNNRNKTAASVNSSEFGDAYSLDGTGIPTLILRTGTQRHSADKFAGKYLFVVDGGGNPDTDVGVKILGNSLSSHGFTPLTLEVPLPGAGFDLAAWNTNYAYGTNLEPKADLWYFRIANISLSNFISNKSILQLLSNNNIPDVKSYDTNYKQVGQYVSDFNIDSAPSTLTLVTKNIDKTGNIKLNAFADINLSNGVFFKQPGSTLDISTGNFSDLIDRDRTSFLRRKETYTLAAGSVISPQFVFDINIVDNDDLQNIQDLFVLPDFTLDMTDNSDLEWYISFYVWVKDIFGRKYPGGEFFKVKEYPQEFNTWKFPRSIDQIKNYIPNDYYVSGNPGDSSEQNNIFFGKIETDGSTNFQPTLEGLQIDSDLIDTINNTGSFEFSFAIIIKNTSGSPIPLFYDLKFKQIAFMTYDSRNITENLYAKIKGEQFIPGGAPTDEVFDSFRHILENYDGIASSDIDYNNLSGRRSDWYVGRQITEAKNSFDYLKELAKQSFVNIWTNRIGKIALKAWREDTASVATYDANDIRRGSIKLMSQNKRSKIFTQFKLNFQWNPGANKYDKAFVVGSVNQETYDSSYTSGFAHPAFGESFWNLAREAYLATGSLNVLEMDLPWYNDRGDFQSDILTSERDQTVRDFLTLLINTVGTEKDEIEFEIPLTAANVVRELLDYITVNDELFTDGNDRDGWINLIAIDPRTDTLKVKVMFP